MNKQPFHMVWDQRVAGSNPVAPTIQHKALPKEADSACTGSRPVTDITPATIARFWAKVAIAGPDDCWLWTGAVSQNGYGSFGLGRKRVSAHRVAFRLGTGAWPAEGLLVCHRCDVRRCENPAHLVAGTHADNMRDLAERGGPLPYSQVGELNHHAKLSREAVARVREQISQGRTNIAIGKSFGVTHSMISRIRRGKSWSKP